jgi:hypothetical protein
MSATNTLVGEMPEHLREAVILAGIADALAWRHLLEMTNEEKSLAYLDRLGPVLETCNIGMERKADHWFFHQKILDQLNTWRDERRRLLACDDDTSLAQPEM